MAVLIPDVRRIAVLHQTQHLARMRRIEEVPPVHPAYRIEDGHVEHLEAIATRARHQRRIRGATDALQDARYHAGPIVAPVVAVEVVPEIAVGCMANARGNIMKCVSAPHV